MRTSPDTQRSSRLRPGLLLLAVAVVLAGFGSNCSSSRDRDHAMVVSVPDQRMALLRKGEPVAVYAISTSRYGIGDIPGSNYTPIGKMEIARKIGGGAPPGMAFKHRRPTGEVVPPNAPGRDTIVTRILWLRGTEIRTRHAFHRYIYIHGTPEEHTIGTPASFGCIRMKSDDVIDLYGRVGVGASVHVVTRPLQSREIPAPAEPPVEESLPYEAPPPAEGQPAVVSSGNVAAEESGL